MNWKGCPTYVWQIVQVEPQTGYHESASVFELNLKSIVPNAQCRCSRAATEEHRRPLGAEDPLWDLPASWSSPTTARWCFADPSSTFQIRKLAGNACMGVNISESSIGLYGCKLQSLNWTKNSLADGSSPASISSWPVILWTDIILLWILSMNLTRPGKTCMCIWKCHQSNNMIRRDMN